MSQQQNMNQHWTDQDMIGDLLAQEKQLISTYGTYVSEGSCPNLRQVLTTNLEQTVQDQFHVFQQMQQRGWYQTKPVQQQDLQMAKQKFTQSKSQMS